MYKRALHSKTGIPIGEELKHNILYGKNHVFDHENPLFNNSNETECGSCYGAEDVYFENDPKNIDCCNTCDEVIKFKYYILVIAIFNVIIFFQK